MLDHDFTIFTFRNLTFSFNELFIGGGTFDGNASSLTVSFVLLASDQGADTINHLSS